MPLFDVNSIHELKISQADRNRLYWLMSQKHPHLEKVLTRVGYELFFAEVEAFSRASARERSRYRPHLIGDETLVAKTHSCCMEYLTQLFCPAEGVKLNGGGQSSRAFAGDESVVQYDLFGQRAAEKGGSDS